MVSRNHSATYQRRNALARERGFSSYSEQRKAERLAKESDLYQRWLEEQGKERVSLRDPDQVAALRTYYQAFHQQPDNYQVTGPKAHWFTDYEEMMTADEWEERYPMGVRTYLR
jgi:hypothetical protein